MNDHKNSIWPNSETQIKKKKKTHRKIYSFRYIYQKTRKNETKTLGIQLKKLEKSSKANRRKKG